MANQESDDRDSSPGRDAIDAALRPIYGDQAPFHYGTAIPFALGGPDPLHGISVYHRTAPSPHFHYVTYGFSDLWGEGESGAEFSKYGFELTFRLACGPQKAEPPAWPLNFLQNIARYVYKTGNYFEAGHHVDCNGRIAADEATELVAIAFALDPELGTLVTNHGRVDFLQIVGLCCDEYEVVKCWKTQKFLDILRRQYPLLITDLARRSLLLDEGISREVEDAIQEEGSSQKSVFASHVLIETIDGVVLAQIGANAVGDLLLMFDHQLAKGNSCMVQGQSNSVVFHRGTTSAWQWDQTVLQITLTSESQAAIRRSLRIERGQYEWADLPGLKFEVVPTEIKDQNGQIVAVIG